MVSLQAMCNTFMGSFAYMAPERFNGQPYGFSSDIWSLGLCAVECATGKYPYEGLGSAPVPLMLAVRSSNHLPSAVREVSVDKPRFLGGVIPWLFV
jgi:serine/threonine protein kinase